MKVKTKRAGFGSGFRQGLGWRKRKVSIRVFYGAADALHPFSHDKDWAPATGPHGALEQEILGEKRRLGKSHYFLFPL